MSGEIENENRPKRAVNIKRIAFLQVFLMKKIKRILNGIVKFLIIIY